MRYYWHRFKRWQRAPLSYDLVSAEVSRCNNCGKDFTGNYCPYCSQKRGVGRITWGTVREGLMEVWGVHSRSLPYSLLQLLFRPGYFISDYISGKRQVSFPPVKMLIIIGVIALIVDHLVGLDSHTKDTVATAFNDTPQFLFLADFVYWWDLNPGWGWLVINIYLLIPTWLIFRHSPRNANHTLPQCFFIFVFLSVQVLIFDSIADLTVDVFIWMVLVCYLFSFKQLFGYCWWGTIWRILVVFLSGIFLVLTAILLYSCRFSYGNAPIVTIAITNSFVFIVSNAILLGVGVLFDHIGKRRREKRASKGIAEQQEALSREVPQNDDGSTVDLEQAAVAGERRAVTGGAIHG